MTVFDTLTPLEQWVEKGVAPDKIIAMKYAGSDQSGGFANPNAGGTSSGQVAFTRPLYPYPLAAKYDGKGDPNSADSFVPVMTPGGANGHYNWVGNDLFRPVPLTGLQRTLYTTTPLIPAPPASGAK